ncbi:hypothetical protein M758_UG116300 [Ceratodon purpureus]|nr:hypothetical protein M758_UG116300 [Ceratodon purpureus]
MIHPFLMTRRKNQKKQLVRVHQAVRAKRRKITCRGKFSPSRMVSSRRQLLMSEKRLLDATHFRDNQIY